MSTSPYTQQRRWSLRARLIALVLAVAAVALVVVDVLLPFFMRTTLTNTIDTNLRTSMANVQAQKSFDAESLARSAGSGGPLTAGDIGYTIVAADGVVSQIRNPVSAQTALPAFGSSPTLDGPFTVDDQSGRAKYRALAIKIEIKATGQPAGYLVAWTPLASVSTAVGGLILTELLLSAGLLLLLGATASVIIRRELKPLEAMATAADDIAEGDLNRRVYPGDAGTEVGRLGYAFNGMLDGISGLMAEREANELRMRQFLADASHELRTPVAAVRGYTDLYKAGALQDKSSIDRSMERMGFESMRMGALVGDLLTLIQADGESDDQHAPVDLAAVLTGVVDDAAVIDRTRVWRLVGADTPGAMVVGDRLRLHQLFANLLANVRTHTEPGTTATITLATTPTEVTVTVSDDGPGVSDEALPRLFDRFFRVDTSRSRIKGGTGLGLSIVAAIVRSHRGRVMAGHSPGGGLTTTVVLPRIPTVQVSAPSARSGAPATRSSPTQMRVDSPESAVRR